MRSHLVQARYPFIIVAIIFFAISMNQSTTAAASNKLSPSTKVKKVKKIGTEIVTSAKTTSPSRQEQSSSNQEIQKADQAAKPTEPTNNNPPDQVTNGKSVDLSKAFIKEEIPPYAYVPLDPEFWQKIQTYLIEGNSVAAIVEGAKREDSVGSDTPEGGEGQLARALGFRERRLYYASFDILVRLAKDRIGSALGEAALSELGRLTQETGFDQLALNQLMVGNEFAGLHADVDTFVSYYKAMDLLQFGFKEWAQVYLNRIKKDSYWDHLFQYWTAVGEVSRNRIENAIMLFQKLMENPTLHPQLFQRVALQYARLIFEQGDFQTALVIYDNLGIAGVREIGRVQLERAWVHYYLKDYSKAMGILTALQAPYFDPSLTFERHILEMIIYRDLCHYGAVEYVAQRFKHDFNDSLDAIHQRRPLRNDRVLFNLAVLHREVQPDANLIDQIRREQQILQDFSWDQFSFFKPLMDEYSRMDQILQARVDRQLEVKARTAANELLDAEEQVQFLDYTAHIDKLRVRRNDDSTYRSQEISHMTFEKIYWPVDHEFWWEEMPDYSMNISSRCGDLMSTDENQLEKDFQ